MDLVRLRAGKVVRRLALAPLFGAEFPREGEIAILQRWQADWKTDFEASQKPDFLDHVRNRPNVRVMHFADYDHDGRAAEFYLQTEALPCGKSFGVVIGITRDNSTLHGLSKVSNTAEPLYLQKRQWEALRRATGPIEVMDWQRGDHGLETETTLFLSWTAVGIAGTRREYSCPPETRRLLKSTPLGAGR